MTKTVELDYFEILLNCNCQMSNVTIHHQSILTTGNVKIRVTTAEFASGAQLAESKGVWCLHLQFFVL